MKSNASPHKRGFFQILAEILESLTEGELPRTHIVYSANLNFKRLPAYLASLEKIGLIEKIKSEGGFKYRITEKGNTFLRRYQDMASMLDEKDRAD